MMHDEVSHGLVESEQQDPEQQSCDFHQHVLNGKDSRHIAQSGEKPSRRCFSCLPILQQNCSIFRPKAAAGANFQRGTLALTTMHPDLEKLLELDKLNQKITALNAEIAALPQKVAAIEKKLAGTQAQLDAAKAALKQVDANKRKYEGDISSLQQKISKYRDQSL